MPIRMSFEDKRDISRGVAFFDTIVDLLFACDSIMTFFIPIVNGEGKPIFRLIIFRRICI